MFFDYYGFIEQPFGVTPDPRFLHMGAKHREALASLIYGTDANRGFLALIAKPGMGKTSLLLQYLELLRNKARTAFVFHTDCDAHDFLRHILADLGLDGSGKDQPTLRGMLNNVLMVEMRAKRRFILVIDEAQNLDERVLESVRLLSNFETPWMKLMQIVIAGQPQLAERLTRPSMAQLRQRISSVIRIEPFTPEETNAYIDHRLWVAGYSGPSLFTVGARLMIAKQSGGIPRNINNLCFNSLSVAYGMDARQVDANMVREAVADVEMESLVPKPERTPPRVPSRPRIFAPALSSPAPKKEHRINRLIPAFACFCVLMLLATFSWVSWNQGWQTPAFDVLFAADAPAIEQSANPGSIALATTSPESAPRKVASRPTEIQISPSVRPLTQSPAVTSAPDARPALKSGFPFEASQPSISAGLSDNDRILTVAIQKEVTLLELSLRHLGKFDDTTLEKTLELNPTLRDLNHIEPGQRIRLPLYLRDDFRPKSPSVPTAGLVPAREERP
jgi:type II secretory pathway predicted ATPase ExeA